MKTLNPTNLIAVEVPKESRDHEFLSDTIGFEYSISRGITFGFTPHNLEGNFEILGEVTDTEISFDVDPYVKSITSILGSGHKDYFDYSFIRDNITKTAYRFTDSFQSFRSLLQSNELFFENPMGKLKEEDYYDSGFNYQFNKDHFDNVVLKEWQSYESKLIKGKLIILKQK